MSGKTERYRVGPTSEEGHAIMSVDAGRGVIRGTMFAMSGS